MDWKADLTSGLSNMFTVQDERDNGTISTIRISDLIPFQGHTFQVKDDEKMMELVESIREHGVMMPAIAFYNENNQLELVAGHRRMRASELAGIDTIPTIIRDIDRDTAIIIMGETNLQARDEILPSEKAFTYKEMLEALQRKRQVGRPEKNASPGETHFSKGRADEEMSEKIGESRATIQRYIRLTYLVPELLQLVDEGKMAIKPAVELSYISSINQQNIYAYYQDSQIIEDGKIIDKGTLPSLSQAKELRKRDKNGELDEDSIAEILDEPKPNQKEKMVLSDDKVLDYGKGMTPLEFEKKLLKALQFYEKYKDKIRLNEDREV